MSVLGYTCLDVNEKAVDILSTNISERSEWDLKTDRYWYSLAEM